MLYKQCRYQALVLSLKVTSNSHYYYLFIINLFDSLFIVCLFIICVNTLFVCPIQMARQQEVEQRSKAQMEKRAQFIEKTKNILVVTEPEPVRKGGGGRRGKV